MTIAILRSWRLLKRPGFTIIVTVSEGSTVWTRLGSHEFVYYRAIVKKTGSSFHMEGLIVSPISAFVRYGWLLHGDPA